MFKNIKKLNLKKVFHQACMCTGILAHSPSEMSSLERCVKAAFNAFVKSENYLKYDVFFLIMPEIILLFVICFFMNCLLEMLCFCFVICNQCPLTLDMIMLDT
jgi:hypothetical protein